MEQSSLISPLVIKDHQLNFEPLKAFTSPTLNMSISNHIRTEFIMSISSIILVLLFITITSVYFIQHKSQETTAATYQKAQR